MVKQPQKAIVDTPKKQMKLIVDNTIEKKHQNYLKLSAVSMGMAAVRQFIYPPLVPLSFALYIYTAIPRMRDVENALVKQRKVNDNVFFFIVDMLTITINQYFAATFNLFLFHRARSTIEKLKKHSEEMLINVFEQQIRTVWLLKDNIEIEISLEDIKANDIIVVKTGEVVPVDGVITKGMVLIDQQALTGESQPLEKEKGDKVFASTFIVSGRIYVNVEKTGAETTVAKIGKLLRNSTDFKSTIQLKGEQWADKAILTHAGNSWNYPTCSWTRKHGYFHV